MSKTPLLRRSCLVGLAILMVGSGCTHNYYYGTTAGCPPIGQTVTTQVGQVCDVPSGTIISSSSTPAPISQAETNGQVIASSNPQRIVISQPAYNPSLRNKIWRRPDPENLATSRVEGALDSSTVK